VLKIAPTIAGDRLPIKDGVILVAAKDSAKVSN
jgi:hypothetical protein